MALHAALERYDMLDIRPMDGMLDTVRGTASMVGTLRDLVGQLDAADLYGPDGRWDENKPHPLMVLYLEWMKEYRQACKDAQHAGLDLVKVRIEEQDAMALTSAMSAALGRVGLSEDQQRAVLGAMAENLRGLAAS